MKKAIPLGLFFLLIALQAFPQTNTTPSMVKFKEITWDFGKVPYASDVSHKFVFKNMSKDRINIREVDPSCGCTTPKYSNEPIRPHRKGSIMVKFDSKRVGTFHKTLEVLMSDQERIVLTIQGEILPKDDAKK